MESERLDLTTLAPGASVTGVCCVRARQLKTTKSGAPFLEIRLGNRTGETTLRVWQERVPHWDGITEGATVRITGRGRPGYQGGAPELEVERVEALRGPHPVDRDLNAVCPVPLPALLARWDRLMDAASPACRVLVSVVVDHVDAEAYRSAPAAARHHHGYIGGLFEHSIEVAELALAIADGTPAYAGALDRDAIIAGALLHDLGKVREYEWVKTPIRVSRYGRLRYHTSSGSEMVAVACVLGAQALREAGVTARDVEHVKHVIESHHRTKEWGSPTEPGSREAMVVHLADLASSQLRAMTDGLQRGLASDDGWVDVPGFPPRALLALDRLPAGRVKPDRAPQAHPDRAPSATPAEPCVVLTLTTIDP